MTLFAVFGIESCANEFSPSKGVVTLTTTYISVRSRNTHILPRRPAKRERRERERLLVYLEPTAAQTRTSDLSVSDARKESMSSLLQRYQRILHSAVDRSTRPRHQLNITQQKTALEPTVHRTVRLQLGYSYTPYTPYTWIQYNATNAPTTAKPE
jgi:hypothetical protein